MEEGSEKKGKAIFLYISKVFLITLFFVFILSIVAVSAIGTFNPVVFRDAFRDLGMYESASYFAENQCEELKKTHPANCDELCDYSGALLTGITISSTALDNLLVNHPFTSSAVQEAAARLKKLTGYYIEASCHSLRSSDFDASYWKTYKNNVEMLSSLGHTDCYAYERNAYSSVLIQSGYEAGGSDFPTLLASVKGAAKATLISDNYYSVAGGEETFKENFAAFLESAAEIDPTDGDSMISSAISLKLCYDAAYAINASGRMTDYFTRDRISQIYSNYTLLIANYNNRSK